NLRTSRRRYNRLRIPGKLFRKSLPYPHQHLRTGQRKQRTTILSLVRPHFRFPHLHHRLESSTTHVSLYKTLEIIYKFQFINQSQCKNLESKQKLKCNKFMVDNIALRVHNNLESMGVPFPSKQPMKFYSSLRNAGLQNGAWQTQGLDAAGRNRLR
ncbi:Probable xyloglucan endotransglucosylase/hydrolase protein 16, partial [Linum perenne]